MHFLINVFITTFTTMATVINGYYEKDCKTVGPLGMILGDIRDNQITASSTELSSWRENCKASQARVYLDNRKSWCAKFKSFSEWLQVDLGTEAIVSGVLTQGRGDGLEWVSTFMISYSSDGSNFHYIKDNYGSQKIFEGNVDSFSVKHNYLDEKIRARFIKFHTYTWHNHPSLRVEILGCQPCKEFLGVFPYGKLSSSGSKGKKRQRTCSEEYGHILSNKGWCSKVQNTNQWLQLDIGQPTLITAVITKGRGDIKRDQWVTHYQTSYSNNSKNWYYYKENSESGPRNSFWLLTWGYQHIIQNGTVFEGNLDKNTERIQYLREPFVARFVRFHPVNWVGKIAMRIGVLGCRHKGKCAEGFFRINDISPCIANLAYKKTAWISLDGGKMQKRHVSLSPSEKHNKYSKHALKAVDGHMQWPVNTEDQQDDTNVHIDPILIRKKQMKTCTVLQNRFQLSNPTWFVNLGEQTTISGVVIYNGNDILFSDKSEKNPEQNQVENVEKISIYVDQFNSIDLNKGLRNEDNLCGHVTKFNKALLKPKVHISCRQPMLGQFVYIQASGLTNRRRTDYKAILCEVMVY